MQSTLATPNLATTVPPIACFPPNAFTINPKSFATSQFPPFATNFLSPEYACQIGFTIASSSVTTQTLSIATTETAALCCPPGYTIVTFLEIFCGSLQPIDTVTASACFVQSALIMVYTSVYMSKGTAELLAIQIGVLELASQIRRQRKDVPLKLSQVYAHAL
jgi:hypothetical protein